MTERAVAPRHGVLCLRAPYLFRDGALHPFVNQRRMRDRAAQLLQPLAAVCVYAHGRVQAEAVDAGAQGMPRRGLVRHCASLSPSTLCPSRHLQSMR